MYTLGAAFTILVAPVALFFNDAVLAASPPKAPPQPKNHRVTIQAKQCQSPDGGFHDETITICVSNPSFLERAKVLAITGDTAAMCMRLLPGQGCDRAYRWQVDPRRVFFADFLAAVWGMYCPSDVAKKPAAWLPPTGKGPARDGLLCLPTVRVLSVR